jgi:hypothetical protein
VKPEPIWLAYRCFSTRITTIGESSVEPNKGTKSFIGFVNTATRRLTTYYIRSRFLGRSLRV